MRVTVKELGCSCNDVDVKLNDSVAHILNGSQAVILARQLSLPAILAGNTFAFT